MKKAISFCLPVVFMLFSGCKDKEVPGCLESEATNYNPNATISDGSCHFTADDFVGTYWANDTIRYTDPNDSSIVTYYESNQFSITKTGPNSVAIMMLRGACNVNGTVTTNSMELVNAQTECNISPFICSRSENTLRYTFNEFRGVTETVVGTAVKQ